MRRDKVNQADAEDCIDNPEFERPQSEDKIEAWKSYRRGFLKVVYHEAGGERVVITVIVKNNRPVWAFT